MTSTDLVERHLLPLMLAFAAGVLLAKCSTDHREAAALDVAYRAVAVAEAYRGHCGPVPDGTAPMLTYVEAQ